MGKKLRGHLFHGNPRFSRSGYLDYRVYFITLKDDLTSGDPEHSSFERPPEKWVFRFPTSPFYIFVLFIVYIYIDLHLHYIIKINIQPYISFFVIL